MTELVWLGLAAGVALGVDWRQLALLGAAVTAPLPAGGLLVLWSWKWRRRRTMDAVLFCDAVSAELRAGASVPAAVRAAALAVEAELVMEALGGSRRELGSALAAQFPHVGRELAEVLSRPDGLGVSPAVLFDEIAGLALAQAEVEAELATATAPSRATAVVLLGLPALAVSWAVAGGRLQPYLAHPAQRAAVLAGIGLVVAGTGLSWFLARRR